MKGENEGGDDSALELGSRRGSRKGSRGPGVSVMVGGNTLLQRTGIGTGALAGCERAILEIVGFDGAVGGGWEK